MRQFTADYALLSSRDCQHSLEKPKSDPSHQEVLFGILYSNAMWGTSSHFFFTWRILSILSQVLVSSAFIPSVLSMTVGRPSQNQMQSLPVIQFYFDMDEPSLAQMAPV